MSSVIIERRGENAEDHDHSPPDQIRSMSSLLEWLRSDDELVTTTASKLVKNVLPSSSRHKSEECCW